MLVEESHGTLGEREEYLKMRFDELNTKLTCGAQVSAKEIVDLTEIVPRLHQTYEEYVETAVFLYKRSDLISAIKKEIGSQLVDYFSKQETTSAMKFTSIMDSLCH